MEPHGQEPVAPVARRNPPKLQSSFAKASEDTRIPPRPGDRGFLRRRVKYPVYPKYKPSGIEWLGEMTALGTLSGLNTLLKCAIEPVF